MLTRDEQDEKDERDYREDVQREIDTCCGTSPEILSLMDAAAAGRKAGMYGHGASMNPFQDHTPEHAEWDKQRLAVIGYRLNSQRAA